MDNFVSDTISVLDGGNLVQVPTSFIKHQIVQFDSNGEQLLMRQQPIELLDNSLFDSGIVGTYNIMENIPMEGTSCYITSENGEQLYEIPVTEELQQLLMGGNEMILVQEVPNSGVQDGQQSSIQDPSLIEAGQEIPITWDLSQLGEDGAALAYDHTPVLLPVLDSAVDSVAREIPGFKFQRADKPANFKCVVCGAQENTFRKLQLHLKSHELEKPFKCSKCSAIFNHEMNLKIHVVMHHSEESTAPHYTCPVCQKLFTRAASFRGHVKVHIVDEDFVCPTCSEPLKTKCLFEIHLQHHRNGANSSKPNSSRIMHCKVCGAILTSLGQLKRHYAQVHPKSKRGDIIEPNDILSKSMNENTVSETVDVNMAQLSVPKSDFEVVDVNLPDKLPSSRASKVKAVQYLNEMLTKKSELDEAIDSAGNLKKRKQSKSRSNITNVGLSCHECEKVFTKRSLLERHLLVHTNERPFECYICKKRFTQKATLKTHMKCHTQEKPFSCNICQRSFAHKCNYKHHMLVGHRIDNSCPGCTLKFPRQIDLIKHISKCTAATNFMSTFTNDAQVSTSSVSILRRFLEEDLPNYNMIKLTPRKRAYYKHPIKIKRRPNNARKLKISLLNTENHRVMECCICRRHYSKAKDLVRHMRIHTIIKPFRCNICFKMFRLQAVYHKHLHSHKISEKNLCIFCSKSFLTTKVLHLHIKMHSISEEYICKLCNSTFTTFTQYKFHKHIHKLKYMQNKANSADWKLPDQQLRKKIDSIHWDEMRKRIVSSKIITPLTLQTKMVSCPLCLNNFSSVCLFRQHLKHHLKNNSFTTLNCKKCGISLYTTVQFQIHYRNHHSNEINNDESKQIPNNNSYSEIELSGDGILKSNLDQLQQQVQKKGDISIDTYESGKALSETTLVKQYPAIPTKKNLFRCSICTKCFHQKSNLDTHMVSHSQDKPYQCSMCNRTFSNKCNYQHHILVGHSASNNCPKCHVYYNKQSELVKHIRTCTSEFQFSTSNLKSVGFNKESDHFSPVETSVAKFFPSGSTVKSTDSTAVQSDTPQSALATKLTEVEVIDRDTGTRQIHRLIQDIGGRRVFECHVCQKHYKKSVDLMRHMRIHTNEKPFRCALCRKSFRVKSVYHTHLRSHQKSKEFACSFCSKSFAMLQTMRVHMRLHTGTYFYSCNMCNRRFTTSSHCNYHMRTHKRRDAKAQLKKKRIEIGNLSLSQPIEPLQWDETNYCLMPTKPPANRVIQSTQYIPERPHRCDECNRVYKSRNHLNAHMRQHSQTASKHVCEYCHKNFATKPALTAHMKTRHLRTEYFQCGLCQSMFNSAASIRRHMVVHSSARPYVCPICNKSFKTKNYCQNHIKLHIRDGVHKAPPTDVITLQDNYQRSDPIINDHPSLESVFTTLMVANTNTGENTSSNCNTEIVECNVTDLTSYNTLDTENTDAFISIDPSDGQTLHNFSVQGTGDNFLNSLEGVSTTIDVNSLFNPTDSFFPLQNDTNSHQQSSTQTMGPMIQLVNCDELTFPTSVSVALGTDQISTNCPLLTQALFSEDCDDRHHYRPVPTQTFLQEVPFSTPICPSTSSLGDNTAGQSSSMNFVSEMSTQALKQKPLYGCKKCDHVFMKPENLVEHVKIAHSMGKPYQCYECNHFFVTLLSLEAHSLTHTRIDPNDKSPFICHICSVSFPKQRSLSSHVITAHSSELNIYRCVHCQNDYRTIRELETHIKKIIIESEAIVINQFDNSNHANQIKERTPIEILESDQTDLIARIKANSRMSLSERYLIEAAKEKQSVGFTGQRKLTQNVKSSQYSSYQCKECLKCFLRPADLKRHLRKHTKERPFSCSICSSSFTCKNSLKTHMNAKHKKESKLYQCHLCNKLFSNAYTLKIHMRVHTSTRKYSCDKCDFTFVTPHLRNKHKKEFHQERDQSKKSIVATNVDVEPVDINFTANTEKEISIMDSNTIVLQEVTDENPRETLEFQILFTPNELAAVGGQQTVTITNEDEQQNILHSAIDNTNNAMMVEQHECKICKTVFPNNCELKQHPCIERQTKIINEQPRRSTTHTRLLCSDCFMILPNKEALLQHRDEKHPPTYPPGSFVCQICSSQYDTRDDLSIHMNVHSQKRSHKCPQCNAFFQKESSMKSHMENVHSDNKSL